MKKLKLLIPITLIITVIVTLLVVANMSVNAETEGYFTYTVSGGEATITDVDTSISGDVTIPSTLGGYPVTSIGSSAFYDCSSLTSIVIPDSVTSIGSSVFYNCSSLTSINIPDSVTSIGWSAFAYCSSLTSVVIPDSVTSIGKYAFSGCSSLTSIVIPDSVTSIGEYAFRGCSSLTSVVIPDSVTRIGEGAFSGCSSLTSIVIPDSVTSIGKYAFYDCNALTTVYYGGTQSDWDKISISYGNEPLTNANIIFTTPDMPIYTISATPEEGGKVTGAGEYEQGTGVTLKATANEGYIFKGWYENGELVSESAIFTFIAEADRTLTAKFEKLQASVEVTASDEDIRCTVNGNVVTVDYALACKVGYLSGDKYVAITATANGDGTYSFTVPEGVSSVAIVVSGDVNGDGVVNAGDYGRLNALLQGKISLTAEQDFAANTNGDATVNAGDYGRINAVLQGKTDLTW